MTALSGDIPQTHTSFADLLNGSTVPFNSFVWQGYSSGDLVNIVSYFSNSKGNKKFKFDCFSNYILKKTIPAIKNTMSFIFNTCL